MVFVAFIILTLKFVNQIYFNMQDQILLTVTNVVDTVAQNHNALNYIKKFTQLTAENTSFEFWWDGFNIVIAVVALLFSVFTFLSQKNFRQHYKTFARYAAQSASRPCASLV